MTNLMQKHTRRLNLYICQVTYDQLERVAEQEGRKVGSLARHLLNRWAESKDFHEKKNEKE